MNTRSAPRLAAASGLLFPVLLVLGDDVIARGDEIAPDAGTAEEVWARLADKKVPSFVLGRSIGALSFLFLLVFACFLAARLRDLRGPRDMLPYLTLTAAAVAVGLAVHSSALPIALVRGGGQGVDPGAAMAMLESGWWFGGAGLPVGLMLGAVAVEAVRGTIMPRWLGWAAAVIALTAVAGFPLFALRGPFVGVAFLVTVLTWIWFIAAAISCLRRVERVAVPGR